MDTYKVFESPEYTREIREIDKHYVEVIRTLKDILLELNDEGCPTRVHLSPLHVAGGFRNPSIYIEIDDIGKIPDSFEMGINIVDGVIKRIICYMRSENYSYSFPSANPSFMDSVGDEEIYGYNKNRQLEIRFDKF